LKIRFQADADLNQTILLATVRQQPGLEFRTATEAGLEGLSDSEVLALTAAQGRLLVSHDLKTMPRHFAKFITTTQSPGLILIPQHLPYSFCAEQLILIWSATDASEWVNRICHLPI
jgi:hypothetical protein